MRDGLHHAGTELLLCCRIAREPERRTLRLAARIVDVVTVERLLPRLLERRHVMVGALSPQEAGEELRAMVESRVAARADGHRREALPARAVAQIRHAE